MGGIASAATAGVIGYVAVNCQSPAKSRTEVLGLSKFSKVSRHATSLNIACSAAFEFALDLLAMISYSRADRAR